MGLTKIPALGKLGAPSPAAYRTPAPPSPGQTPGRPPPDLARPAIAPRGPRHLRLGQKRIFAGSGPGPAPTVFTTDPQLSGTEWILYWASAKYFNNPRDPRVGPFVGATDGSWTYQTPEGGSTRQVGSSVSDFVYTVGSGIIVVRLDTFYWHTAAPAAQQARDRYLAIHAVREGVIVRVIYDTQLLGDPTGAKAVRALADVLAGRELIAPVRSGLAFAPRESAEFQA